MRVLLIILLLQIFVVLVVERRVGLRVETVAKLSPLTRATRRRSDGRLDGVTVASRRVDAIDATSS